MQAHTINVVEGTGNRRFSPVTLTMSTDYSTASSFPIRWFLHVLGHCPGHHSCVSFAYFTLPPGRACEANDQRSTQRSVRSEYAPTVWDGCPKRDSVALERIQLAVARAVLRCSRRDVSNMETLCRSGWPTLAWRCRRQKLSVLWDLLQQRGPPKLCDKVPRTAAQHCDYSLRNSSSPAIPLCRTFHCQNSFLPASLAQVLILSRPL